MANVYDFKARNHVFEDIAALRAVANFNLTGQGEPERLNGSRVSANLFPVLRRHAARRPHLSRRTRTRSATSTSRILSYGLWQRRFGGDPAIVGRTILAERRAAHGRRRDAARLRLSDPRVSRSTRRSPSIRRSSSTA